MKLFLYLIAIFMLLAIISRDSNALQVKVRSAQVRSSPQYWATSLGTLKYGDSIDELSNTSGWLKIRFTNGKSGYLHESAVSAKTIVFQGRSKGVSSFSNASEVVLAGKGFSKEAEKQLAMIDSSLNLKAVDSMEKLRVGNSELLTFLKAGKLNS